MSTKNIDNYYNRFDAGNNYDEIFFRDGYGAQASEHNELQSMLKYRMRGIADAQFKNGDIISDAQIAVNAQTGEVQAGSGAVYLDGAVRGVAARSFSIPLSGTVTVGIRLIRKVISEEDDASLRNPALGTGTHQEPGAWRLQVTPQWGHDGDGGDGDFYAVHTVDDGLVRSREAPPNLDSFNQGIARYDRDSTGGGSYIVSGLVLRNAESSGDGAQIYTVSEGRARVHGYGIELATSRRLAYAATPDLRLIDTEVVTADGTARQRIEAAHAPIHSVTMLRLTLQKTVNLTHGAYSGAADALPNTSIVSIIECRQGDTVYEQGVNYKKTGDSVDWSLAGAEPAAGSTYECTYTYMTAAEALDLDYDGFFVENAVAGSSIIFSYQQALPRYDRLCLTQDGAFVWRKGIAAEYNARKPETPNDMLALASVYQTWREQSRISNDGIRVSSFDDMTALAARVDYALTEVARTRLESSITAREAGARVGIFVDPLHDDSMRDQGLAQSAAIVDGELTLSIAGEVKTLASPQRLPVVAAYTPQAVLSQLLRTGSMLVNPYMAFDALPARVSLEPAVDQWTEVETQWTSATTQRFNVSSDGGWKRFAGQSTATSTQLVDSQSADLEYLREISVAFTVQGFGAGEKLTRVLFDGVEAVFSPSQIIADATGALSGTFVIPPKIPAGAKTVTFQGAPVGGNSGSAVFVGQGRLTVNTLRQVQTITTTWYDPLAQTFVLDANAQICGVDLWFTNKSGEVRVQIREVQNGVPTRTILAEAVLAPENIVVTGGGHTRALFSVLVQLLAATEYAVVVLCNDAITAVSVAEMGKFDAYKQTNVSSQPYTVGVLLSSSNASTWTAHQDRDLTFRLLEAGFASGVTSVNMGSVEVSEATDLVLLALDESPAADTRVDYELELPDGNSLIVANGQPARLAAPVSGAVSVRARMSGTRRSAPLLWPGAQLLAGSVSQIDDYYSRSIPATGAQKATLIYDAYIPSGAGVKPEVQLDGGSWQAMEQGDCVQQGDGLVEYSFSFALAGAADLLKARLTLSGNATARPRVSNIRLMAVK